MCSCIEGMVLPKAFMVNVVILARGLCFAVVEAK